MQSEALSRAQDLAEAGDIDAAYKLCDKALRDDPNDPQWLNIMTYVMLSAHKYPIAYSLAKRVTQLAPKNAGAWLNMGMAANDLWRPDEAMRCNKKGLKLSTDPHQISMLGVNAASVLLDSGKFTEAEKYAKQALEANPESSKAKSNLGFSQLGRRQWREGWKNYRETIGCEWRPRQQYANEPDWDGKSKGTIVIWADQGMGDVISAASMLPDMLQWAADNDSRVILDVDPRLKGVLKRTFTDAKVYGTRTAKVLAWDAEDTKVDYSLPIMQLGEYFRNDDKDFPGTPYLQPDPDRVLQWNALFDSKQKPVIGLAWSGGIDRTGARFRRVDLEALLPVLRSVDAHWVSLQYKPAGNEIARFKAKHPEIDLVEYPHGTLTNDYDDTIAMVASLDLVFAVHTTVIHAAGALGVPCWTLVPQNSQWRYGEAREDYVWANSVRLLPQIERGKWGKDIKQAAEQLHAHFARVPEKPTEAARQRELRRDGEKVRGNGKWHHRQAGT